MKIVVVDDEEIVLRSCRKVLEAEGFEVLMATSVDDALDTIDTQNEPTPFLLLIDVKMPVRDGMQLMRIVKARRPDLPIIVMSGYPTQETIQTAGSLGAAHFIAKPFTPDELLSIVFSVPEVKKNHNH